MVVRLLSLRNNSPRYSRNIMPYLFFFIIIIFSSLSLSFLSVFSQSETRALSLSFRLSFLSLSLLSQSETRALKFLSLSSLSEWNESSRISLSPCIYSITSPRAKQSLCFVRSPPSLLDLKIYRDDFRSSSTSGCLYGFVTVRLTRSLANRLFARCTWA